MAGALGCPHFTTFDSQNFDFQGAGEFVAVKSTISGDNFQVQMRIEPEGSSDSSVSIITQIAMQVGNSRVTFGVPQSGDTPRSSVLMVDGAAISFGASPVFTLPGGTITEVSSNEFIVALKTGEKVTVNPFGDGMGLTIALAANEGAGSVQGFLGTDSGKANDFSLPDGTVLQQPLTQDQLYHTFADAWRVTDATSLLDYAPGQTTATFTNTQYPREILTLADFPADLVAKAAALVAAAGITDPVLAADAEFDYISMGNPSFISEDAAVAALNPTAAAQAVITQPVTPPPAIGILPDSSKVVEQSGGATAVTFDVNLTSASTTDTVVDYAVTPDVDYLSNTAGKTFFTAADFGGTLPSGSVTIAAGKTEAAITVDVPASALGSTPDKWLGISISSAGGNPVYDPTAQVEIVNNHPVAGTLAQPALELLPSTTSLSSKNNAALTQVGNSYTLDLGQVLEGVVLLDFQLAIANLAPVSADGLKSYVSAVTGTGAQLTGTQPASAIAAGGAFSDLHLQPLTTSLGAQSETLTLFNEDVNDTGYLGTLPTLTLTLKDTVVGPAEASVGTDTITFDNVRVGTADSQTITVGNIASEPAANLDATAMAGVGTVASGSVSQLAPGLSDVSDITVGLDTSKAGAINGTVTLNIASDLGNGVSVPALPSPTIKVAGNVYREAAGTIAPMQDIVHVGDAGTENLVISNIDPNDGFSEGLRASLVSSSGAIGVAGASTGLIAAGGADTTSMTAKFSTASASVLTGNVGLGFVSDGTGTSGLAPFDLGTADLPLSITVDNYAAISIADLDGVGILHQNGNTYTLALGTIEEGATAPKINLGVLNGAAGPADLLSGNFSISGSSAFANSGFDSFSDLVAGGAAHKAPTVSLATTAAGAFSETITLDPTGSNASGYSGALAPVTLTITGTVHGRATVQSVAANPSAGDFGPGKVVDFTVTMSEAVTVAGLTASTVPALALKNGGAATYQGGSGTNVLTFAYSVGALDSGQDIAALAVTGFNANGATLSGSNGIDSVDLSGVTKLMAGPKIDTTAPKVAIGGTGGVTSQAVQTISGTVDVADAKTAVTILDGTTPVGTAVVAEDGTWSKSITLTHGVNVLTATDTDAAGNTGTSKAVTDTLQGEVTTTTHTLGNGAIVTHAYQDGVLTQAKVVLVDGSSAVADYSGLAGDDYQTRYRRFDKNGSTVLTTSFAADGSLVSNVAVDADGSIVTDSYHDGVLTQVKVVEADGSSAVATYSGIAGNDYKTSNVRYDKHGAPILTTTFAADGSLTSNKAVTPNGTIVTDAYQAGVLRQAAVVQADGSSAIADYSGIAGNDYKTGYSKYDKNGSPTLTTTYAADGSVTGNKVVNQDGSITTDAYQAGVLTQVKVVQTNGSSAVADYSGIAGNDYHTSSSTYGKTGSITQETTFAASGAATSKTLYGSNGSLTTDVFGFNPATTTVAFQENAGDTAGTLTVGNAGEHLALMLFGQYAAAGFSAPHSDGHGGSLIAYTPPQPQLTVAHV